MIQECATASMTGVSRHRIVFGRHDKMMVPRLTQQSILSVLTATGCRSLCPVTRNCGYTLGGFMYWLDLGRKVKPTFVCSNIAHSNRFLTGLWVTETGNTP